MVVTRLCAKFSRRTTWHLGGDRPRRNGTNFQLFSRCCLCVGCHARPLLTVCLDRIWLSRCSVITNQWSMVPAATICGTYGLLRARARQTSCWRALPSSTEPVADRRLPSRNWSILLTLHVWLCMVLTYTQSW